MDRKLKTLLEEVIETHEKYKKSYFWSSGQNAGQRRRNEERFPSSNIVINLVNGDEIEIYQSYSESCNHCYYKGKIHLNGCKKDIRLVKKLLKDLSVITEVYSFGERVYNGRQAKIKSALAA